MKNDRMLIEHIDTQRISTFAALSNLFDQTFKDGYVEIEKIVGHDKWFAIHDFNSTMNVYFEDTS
jgi:hypothetical protein